MDVVIMSDKQLMNAYYKAIAPETWSMMTAGTCAGELIDQRGYIIIERNGIDVFVKKEEKKDKVA